MKILVDNKIKCGVYKIRNLVNNKCYIGSTTGLLKYRCITHRYHLQHNKHTNQHLQNSWNKYGENNFEFSLVELCQPNQCFDREQYYIDVLKPNYNILQFAGGTLGYKHTNETKKKISVAFTGKNHPAYSGEYIFYHPVKKYYIGGRIYFADKYKLKKIRIHKLCGDVSNQYKGWICLGKHTSNFEYPENIDEIYNQRIEKSNRNKNLKETETSFIHNNGISFTGSIINFSKKYNLHLRCVIRLYNGGRKQYKGWKINKIDENKKLK